MIRFVVTISGTAPDRQRKLTEIGKFLLRQLKRRFRTGGASGGQIWDRKWIGGKSYLGGPDGSIARSYRAAIRRNSVSLESDYWLAYVHNEGTVSKGGSLPDITPKHAKALMIPITERACAVMSGTPALNSGTGKMQKGTPVGMESLIPGRIKDGILERQTADGEYVPGTPDFIFLKRVSIPPRKQLPDSGRETSELQDFIQRLYEGEVEDGRP